MTAIQTPYLTQIEPRAVVNDLTVVIPTLGRAILQQCLRRIVLGTTWPAQIIVVDQSSSAEIRAWLGQLKSSGLEVEHVPSSQRGKAAALNRGIERVKTPFVAITDDDCFVERDWLENMVTRMRQNPEAVITGPAYPEGENDPVAAVTCPVPVISRRPGLKFDIFCGSNMAVATGILALVGLFDEDPCLVAAEDCEWSYRVLRSGVHIIYAPEVRVRHFGWRDASQRADRRRDYGRSLGGFYGKYLRRGDWFIAVRLIITLLRVFRRSVRGLIIGQQQNNYLAELAAGIIAGWRRGRPS
jgi:GT2 family glycosyltransferase